VGVTPQSPHQLSTHSRTIPVKKWFKNHAGRAHLAQYLDLDSQSIGNPFRGEEPQSNRLLSMM
jgi:hypothetical protein